jgi:hypothetical protein
MKKTVILAVTLLLAALPVLGSSGVYITELNHANGTFQLSNRTYWRALYPRTIGDWQVGDDVVGTHSASCGNDPNAYLLTDTDQSESACAQRIGR